MGAAARAVEGADRDAGEEVAGLEREAEWGGEEDRAGVVGWGLDSFSQGGGGREIEDREGFFVL